MCNHRVNQMQIYKQHLYWRHLNMVKKNNMYYIPLFAIVEMLLWKYFALQIFIIEVKSLLLKVSYSIIYSTSPKRNCIPLFPWEIRTSAGPPDHGSCGNRTTS